MIERMNKSKPVDVVDLIVQQELDRKRALGLERKDKKVQRRIDRSNKRGLRYV